MKNTRSLNKNTLFKRLYYRGKTAGSKYFVLYYMPNNYKDRNHLGLTVSKKVGKAVTRNHIRRLFRESYRLYEDNIRLGYNIVIVAKSSAAVADFDTIRSQLGGVLKKADLFLK